MKILTARIPDDLVRRLKRKAEADRETVSEVVRRALIRELASEAGDFAKLAAPFAGMFRGPRDLSTREGYGSDRLG